MCVWVDVEGQFFSTICLSTPPYGDLWIVIHKYILAES